MFTWLCKCRCRKLVYTDVDRSRINPYACNLQILMNARQVWMIVMNQPSSNAPILQAALNVYVYKVMNLIKEAIVLVSYIHNEPM